jgi:tetratricopeptide (TPR) repeat protein
MEFEWVETEASLSRALALEPMNVHVIQDFAFFLRFSGRVEEGLALMGRAVALDPLDLVIRMDYGWSLFDARRFRQVIEEANRILERDPSFAPAYDLLGASYRWLGDFEASYKAFRQYNELGGRPAWYLGAWDRGYEQGGFKEAYGRLLAAIRKHDHGSISHAVRAIVACGAEEPEEALVELNHALRRRDPRIVVIGGPSPAYDCVRSDPRYEELLRKINWPGLQE